MLVISTPTSVIIPCPSGCLLESNAYPTEVFLIYFDATQKSYVPFNKYKSPLTRLEKRRQGTFPKLQKNVVKLPIS